MKKILAVIDMQNDFITGPLGNAECVACVPEVIKAIENPEYDSIVVTRDTHQENYMDTMEGKRLPVVHCIEGTEGWELIPEVKEALSHKDYKLYNKPTFGCTKLGEDMNRIYNDEKEDIQVDFVGVCTGICVISNAMLVKANCPNATIQIIQNACACVTPDSHNTALEAMKLCHIDII